VLNEDPYCQRKRCYPLNVLFYIMFLALICHIFFSRGPSYLHRCRALTLALARLSCSLDIAYFDAFSYPSLFEHMGNIMYTHHTQ